MACRKYGEGISMLMLKAVIYCLISSIFMVVLIWALVGDVELSIMVGAANFLFKLALYFFFEKFWDYTSYRIYIWRKYLK